VRFFPYYDYDSEAYRLSCSETVTITYKLHELPTTESEWIIMTATSGSVYLPSPFVPAPRTVYSNYVEVVGTWKKDKNSKYFLDVSSVEENKGS
jgi:hypothetical protein